MAAMMSCLLGAILLAAGGVTAAEAQTIVAPDVVQPPAAAAVVTTVPSATVVAQTTPVETTRQVTTTYRTRDRGRVVRRTVVTTRTSPVVVPRTVTEQFITAPVQNVAPVYATPPYAVQGYTVAPAIDQVGPPAEVVAPAPVVTGRVVAEPGYAPAPAVVAPVAPPRAYRYVYLDDRTLVVDPVTNALLATYWR